MPSSAGWLLKVAGGLFLELCHRLHTLPKMSAGAQEQGAHLLPSPVPRQGEEGQSGDFTGASTGVPRLPCCAHTPPRGWEAPSRVQCWSPGWSQQPCLHPRTSRSSHSFILLGFFMQTLKYTPLIFFCLLVPWGYFRRRGSFAAFTHLPCELMLALPLASEDLPFVVKMPPTYSTLGSNWND